jgi:hypothetical protein
LIFFDHKTYKYLKYICKSYRKASLNKNFDVFVAISKNIPYHFIFNGAFKTLVLLPFSFAPK